MSTDIEVEAEVEVSQAEDITSLLDDSAPVLADGEWYQSEGVKGTGESPDWYQSKHFKNANEQAKGYSELQKKFGSFTGTPKDGYSLPEGIEPDDELAMEYSKLATDMGMNQEGFNKGFELLSSQMGVNAEISQENELAKLGDNAGQRIKAVENALKFRAGDGYDEIKDMITTADGVILAESLIKAFAPQKLPMDGGENPTGITWSDLEVMLHAKDEHGNMKMSVDLAHKEKYERLKKEWGGDRPNIVTVS